MRQFYIELTSKEAEDIKMIGQQTGHIAFTGHLIYDIKQSVIYSHSLMSVRMAAPGTSTYHYITHLHCLLVLTRKHVTSLQA